MSGTSAGPRRGLAFVGGFAGAVVVGIVLWLVLRAIGVAHAGAVAGVVVVVAAVAFLFWLGARTRTS
ncbi:hypothetical protein [Nocardioides mangrovicus]|uniref:hypothetical protein n=1 Tax=Nocardioides mangrovicus TaxID=2478913 RepID=UPI0011C420EC|nr:hypothetical protein [Nocardioides mangrovicus]